MRITNNQFPITKKITNHQYPKVTEKFGYWKLVIYLVIGILVIDYLPLLVFTL